MLMRERIRRHYPGEWGLAGMGKSLLQAIAKLVRVKAQTLGFVEAIS